MTVRTYPYLKHGQSNLPDNLIKLTQKLISKAKNIEQFIHQMFPNLENFEEEYFFNNNSVILTTLNKNTFEINDLCAEKIKKKKTIYKIIDSLAQDDNQDMFPREF